MTENRRESMTPVGIVGTPKTVAPQRLAITNENHRKRPAAKAGVAGSNPAGGTSVLAVQRPFFQIARGLWLPNDYIDPQGQPTASKPTASTTGRRFQARLQPRLASGRCVSREQAALARRFGGDSAHLCGVERSQGRRSHVSQRRKG